MIITKIHNNTNSVVTLREGQVGVLRKVCEIQPGGCHQVRSNLTATYKEYWCAVQPSVANDKFILTSDDCIDWKEIEIRPKENDKTKFEWKGMVAAKSIPGQGGVNSRARSGSDSSPSSTALSSLMSKVMPKKVHEWLSKHNSPGN